MVRARGSAEIYGLTETRRLLRSVAPDLLKEMDREIRQEILGPLRDQARSLVPASEPLSRWNDRVLRPGSRRSYSPWGRRWPYERLEWDSGRVKAGITVRVGGSRTGRSGFRGAWSLLNRDPAGAVFELMGSGKSRTAMVGNVRVSHGISKRLIWKAWDDSQAQTWAPRALADTVARYEVLLQGRFDAAGGRS